TLTSLESTPSFSNNLRPAPSAPIDGYVGVVRILIFQRPCFSSAATRSVKVPPMSIPTLIIFFATFSLRAFRVISHIACCVQDSAGHVRLSPTLNIVPVHPETFQLTSVARL